MKSIKTYLNLALSIAFCASFHAFAMEPMGESNMSNESGIATKDKQTLERYIKRLQKMDNLMIAELKDPGTSDEKRKTLIQILNSVNETIITANNMVLGLIPVNTDFIIEKTKIIIRRWNQK
jgi:hypothetical protein